MARETNRDRECSTDCVAGSTPTRRSSTRGRMAAAARVPDPPRARLLVGHTGLVRYLAHRIGSRLAGRSTSDTGRRRDPRPDGGDRPLRPAAHACSSKTYAESRIRGAILDGVRARDWAPRSPPPRRHAGSRPRSAAVEHRTRRTAQDEEIAAELEISVDELHALYQQARGVRLGHMRPARRRGAIRPIPAASPS